MLVAFLRVRLEPVPATTSRRLAKTSIQRRKKSARTGGPDVGPRRRRRGGRAAARAAAASLRGARSGTAVRHRGVFGRRGRFAKKVDAAAVPGHDVAGRVLVDRAPSSDELVSRRRIRERADLGRGVRDLRGRRPGSRPYEHRSYVVFAALDCLRHPLEVLCKIRPNEQDVRSASATAAHGNVFNAFSNSKSKSSRDRGERPPF